MTNMKGLCGFVVALTGGVLLAACTRNPANILAAQPTVTSTPVAPPPHTLYVADTGVSAIFLFPDTTVGGTAYAYIGGFSTHLRGPWGIALDAAGNVWVSNSSGQSSGNGASVTEYKAGAVGDTPAITYILGLNTTLTSPAGLAVDNAGTVYVGDFNVPEVAEFTAGSNGNVKPTRVITGANTTLTVAYSLALDQAGNLWVGDRFSNNVLEFAKGASGNVAPVAVLTQPSAPRAEYFDSAGNLWVADDGSTEEYQGPIISNGQSPVFSNGNTGIGGPRGIAVDASGNVFVSDGANGNVGIFPAGNGANPFTAKFAPLSVPRGLWVR